MAATKVKKLNIRDGGNDIATPYNVAASTQIFAGRYYAKDSNGDLILVAATTAVNYVGVAMDSFDNSASGSATLTKPVRILTGMLHWAFLSGATEADKDKIAYASDEETVTLTLLNNAPMGKIIDVDLNLINDGNNILIHDGKPAVV